MKNSDSNSTFKLKTEVLTPLLELRDLVLRSRHRDQRVPGAKPGSIYDPPYMLAFCPLNPTSRVKRGVVRKFGEGMPAQVSSSSSDRGLK
ncbi:hypothetical protein AVEN_137152-1 [Araneus ventricosus]|uniref:Uncharacterized protein n=1 Tax=Araneus ventricosus TaxID=182803 RepID=A0A4Y2Q556_ARAVE|nr:hypothetical protein AVEN_137152-1 [Araneus ventricosus]